MTEPVQLALIAGAVTALPTIFGLLNTIIARRMAGDMKRLEANTNHKMDQLLETVGDAREAEGKLKGKAEEKANSSHVSKRKKKGKL